MAVVICIRGPSGSGKTTLIERLIPRLSRRGLSVGVVKHAHDGFQLDRRGKDSWRMWEAGAESVVVAGPREALVRRRLPACAEASAGRRRASLKQALSLLPPRLDCVLIEGFGPQTNAGGITVHVRLDLQRTRGQRLDDIERVIVSALRHANDHADHG